MIPCTQSSLNGLVNSPNSIVKVISIGGCFIVRVFVGDAQFFLKAHRGNERVFKSYNAMENVLELAGVKSWSMEKAYDVA